MRHILAPSQRALLEQLSWSNVLLGFDFDGTLCPIVRDPARAALRAGTRRLLAQLCEIYPCMVISGRALGDVRARLAGLPLSALVGNHGLEPGHATQAIQRTVCRWRAELAGRLAGSRGVEIEDKQYSLAIHFRRSRRKRQVRALIAEAVSDLGDLRLIAGKQVINLLPPGAPHKGMALLRERARLGCDTALFVGDDETDEDVFGLEQPGRLLSVRVGPVPGSAAAYCLRSQTEIDELLRALIQLRREAGGCRQVAAR